MTQGPCKEQPSETSLPDWLAFLKPQQAEEDPFHVKGPKLLPLVDKKEPHVITGTHNHGNLKCIGEKNQNLVKDTSLSKPITIVVEEPPSSSPNDPTKAIDETSNPSGTWSMWLIILVVFWLFSMSLPKPSPHDWIKSPILSPSPRPSSQRDDSTTMSTAPTITTTGTNLPIPKRIATIILQELSPFPSPPDQDMTPIINLPWKSSGVTEHTTLSMSHDGTDIVSSSIEGKRPVSEELTRIVRDSVQQLDKSRLEPSTIDVCDHSWQWILHRSCRVQRRNQGTTPPPKIDDHNHDRATTTVPPTTIDQSSIDPCPNWFSRDCRVQKRARTGTSSSSTTGSGSRNAKGHTRESHPNSPSRPIFKEQTVKAVRSLLEAAYQTHKLVNLWIQEELQTSNLVEPQNSKYS